MILEEGIILADMGSCKAIRGDGEPLLRHAAITPMIVQVDYGRMRISIDIREDSERP